ncbi:MAG: ATP-binding protein [Anaerolineae bacterium]|nr:ATP-binding protein [Anaerolineae bacterium]MCI0610769.1 ATP-binding protein [Anaerolineae bacterium]
MLSNIRRWLAPPVFEGDEDKSRAATLLNIILWVFIIGAVLYGLFAPIEPEVRYRRVIIIVPFVLVLLLLKQMVNWGYIRSTGTMIVFALWALFTVAMFYGADYNNPAFMGYLVVVICAGLILNWRAAIGWSLFSIFTSAVFLILGQNGMLPQSTPTSPLTFWTAQTVYILVSTILISQSLRKIDEALAKAQRELNERKRVEAERENVIKELEAKNSELERFTYTVSHDLKSPLVTISGFVGLLEADARSGNTEKFKGDLERISEATKKMQRLLNELLELSRIGRLMNPPSDVPFEKIVDEALALTRGRLMAGNTQVEIQDDLPVVHGDRARLVEVMQNLIDNAAKFSSEQPESRIEIGMREENHERVFFVRDNGIGIAPQFHQRIFGLFDKLDATSEGTGIGLALVKRIIEVHGGRIWVESEKGKGATFCFTLPLAKKQIS